MVEHFLTLKTKDTENIINFLNKNKKHKIHVLNFKFAKEQDLLEIHFKTNNDLLILTLSKNKLE